MKKNEKDNKYANISSYIPQTDLMKYIIHSTNCRTKQSHPHGDDHTQIEDISQQ